MSPGGCRKRSPSWPRADPSPPFCEPDVLTLRRAIDINRDAGAVFGLISDPARYPEFLVGITKWQLCSEKKRGLGASFRVLMRVGSIEAGGAVKVTDWQGARA